MDNENKILVIYVGVQGIRSEDIPLFSNKLANKIIPETFYGEVIVIPTQSIDTRVDCINPKYITNKDLINEHEELMKKLQYELQIQLGLMKKERNE